VRARSRESLPSAERKTGGLPLSWLRVHEVPTMREVGHGMEALMLLKDARTMAGDPHFHGSASEAIRLCSLNRDANPKNAAIVMSLVRPPERMNKAIREEREASRAQFRRRLCEDFDMAIAKLLDARPSKRRELGVRAAREAWNHAGTGLTEKRAKWAGLWERVVQFEKEKPQ
jgi:hypothetical protein